MADEKIIEAARALRKQLGWPSDKFMVYLFLTDTIFVGGYIDDLKKLDIPNEFMGYKVALAPLDEAMGT